MSVGMTPAIFSVFGELYDTPDAGSIQEVIGSDYLNFIKTLISFIMF